MSRSPVKAVACVAGAAAAAFALRTWAVPAWRRYAEQAARDAELHAG